MTRVYDTQSKCSSCKKPGQFGWLYRCTQDREDIIEKKLHLLDRHLLKGMGVRKGGPVARQDKLSFLEEVTPEQMAKYRPDQIATILRQREELKNVIAKEQFRKNSDALFSTTRPPPQFEVFTNDSIYAGRWTCGEEEECHYKICSRCRPACADRAFLSLNAVADGKVPPTAATGFGFEELGGKPVVSSDILKGIREHAPRVSVWYIEPKKRKSLPTKHQPGSFQEPSYITQRLMMQMLEEQIERYSDDRQIHDEMGSSLFNTRLRLQSSTRANAEAAAHLRDQEAVMGPGSLGLGLGLHQGSHAHSQESEHGTHQRQNPQIVPYHHCPIQTKRARLVSRILANNAPSTPPDRYVRQSPDASESGEAAPLYPFNDSQGPQPQATGDDDKRDEFTPAPLRVGHGVAVTEGSIESGLPDVVTQV
ncbi:hypothetical protein NM208_g8698 [Fusarium decemcellulare]|uniref:Uncharacterized protein n=1 Tax=Fusarium decemcellulare TaxID=57161 RepID=A0ACC1S4L8_9HYPO|nr:hypothetical protein NM208_g8698 [Fusarium decemcellulare]